MMKSRQRQLVFSLLFLWLRKETTSKERENKQEKKEKVAATTGSQGGCPPLLNTDFDTYVSKSVLSYSH
jgi:hypothetical protein